MSNENSSTNRPLKSSKARYRSFSLTSYLSISQVSEVLYRKEKQITTFAYILHDKDTDGDGNLKEPHVHILLRLYHPYTVDTVRNWFYGYVDDDNKPINTLGQPLKSELSAYLYLTHSDLQSREEGKYQYDEHAIFCNDVSYWKDHTAQKSDNLLLALEDMLNGKSAVECARRYGRDFIIHSGQIFNIFKWDYSPDNLFIINGVSRELKEKQLNLIESGDLYGL